MPFYVWACEKCGESEQTFEHKMEPKAPTHCEVPMERDYHGEARRHTPGSGWPMTTKHLTGKEETFNSAAELESRCKELGVAWRPDAAFVEKEFVGHNWKTGKPEYREGNGAGLPGSWI